MKISFYLKIGVMLISLGAVLYAIQALRSRDVTNKISDPQSALGILIGSDYRPLNWCPPETIKVEIYSFQGTLQKTLSSPEDVSAVCEIMMGAFSSEGIEEKAYRQRLVAVDARGENKVLQQHEGRPIFRVQGMPFSSPMLEKALVRIEAP